MVRGSNPGRDKIFRNRLDRLWAPLKLLHNGYRVSFLGVKRLRHDFDRPLPCSTEFKEIIKLYLYPPSGSSRPLLGWKVPSFFPCMFLSAGWFWDGILYRTFLNVLPKLPNSLIQIETTAFVHGSWVLYWKHRPKTESSKSDIPFSVKTKDLVKINPTALQVVRIRNRWDCFTKGSISASLSW